MKHRAEPATRISNEEVKTKSETEIENLKREIERLKQKQTTQIVPVATPELEKQKKIQQSYTSEQSENTETTKTRLELEENMRRRLEIELEQKRLLELEKQRQLDEEASRQRVLEYIRQQTEALNQQEMARKEQRRTELERQKQQIIDNLAYLNIQKGGLENDQNAITILESQRKSELENLERQYNIKLESLRNDFASRGLTFSGMRQEAEANLLADYNYSKTLANNYYDSKINEITSEQNDKEATINYKINESNRALQQINQELSQ